MGFLPDIRRILRGLPRTPRQTLFFSATMPAPIVSLSKEMLHDPAMIDIKRTAAPATGITQAFYPVPAGRKVALLVDLLEQGVIGNAIVFTRTKHRANRVADRLDKLGVSAAKIHGNRSQNQRTEALAGFKDGRFRVLVATDIVARGIDVEALGHVINFDVPAVPEDYIHRVGRTARAEATGTAFTLVAPEDEEDVRRIERALGAKITRARLEGFAYDARGEAPLEVPRGERIAAIRAKKATDRAIGKAKRERAEGGHATKRGYGAGGSSHSSGGNRSSKKGGRSGSGARTAAKPSWSAPTPRPEAEAAAPAGLGPRRGRTTTRRA
jgi:ATP-dependent RNA helicase RhlE